MPYICKNPYGTCPGKVHPQENRHLYDNHKRCKVCEMYVMNIHIRCPCCNCPLRCKSKRNYKVKL